MVKKSNEISKSDGIKIVKLARNTIKAYFEDNNRIEYDESGVLSEQRGVFVTLRSFPDEELRGCIGQPYPSQPLGTAIFESALSAAFKDFRFPKLKQEELDKITFEVTVLTVPVEISGDYEKNIKIGTDGLIIEYGQTSGLLLPQVPIEFNWTPKEFLQHLCGKAGLPRDMWKSPNVKIHKFQGEIFEEIKPDGEIKRKRLII